MPMPLATMSCAAPTRVLCPEMWCTTAPETPARLAIALKMRGIWLASSPSPTTPRHRERNSRPSHTPLRCIHSRTRPTLSRARYTVAPRPSGSALERRTSTVAVPLISSRTSDTSSNTSSERRSSVSYATASSARLRTSMRRSPGASSRRWRSAPVSPLACACRPPRAPVHALERPSHGVAARRLGPAERPVRGGDAGDVAAHRRGGPDPGHGVDKRGDGRRARGQRRHAAVGTPGGVDGEVRAHGPLGVGAQRPARGHRAGVERVAVGASGVRRHRAAQALHKHRHLPESLEHDPAFDSR